MSLGSRGARRPRLCTASAIDKSTRCSPRQSWPTATPRSKLCWGTRPFRNSCDGSNPNHLSSSKGPSQYAGGTNELKHACSASAGIRGKFALLSLENLLCCCAACAQGYWVALRRSPPVQRSWRALCVRDPVAPVHLKTAPALGRFSLAKIYRFMTAKAYRLARPAA